MSGRMNASRRGVAFAAPFAVFALAVIGYGIYQLTASPPDSWTLVLTVIAGVIICSPFQVRVTRTRGFPSVGVAIAMLAIPPQAEAPVLSVAVWAIGIAISQAIMHRRAPYALYVTGLSTVSAFAFVAVETWLESRGAWMLPTLLLATVAYYTVYLLGEAARERIGAAAADGAALSSLSPGRVVLLVLAVTATAALMNYVDASVIPWLEQDPDASLTPFVVLLAASLFYILAQRSRYAGIERRLSGVVDAAVDLPRESGAELVSALQNRARSIVQADDVELRERSPERDEIGAAVSLDLGADQFLVASRGAGGTPFVHEDERALAILAHVASEAARIQYEVDILERRANSDALTGLPNYGAFQKALAEANENRAYHEGIALLFMDLDNFKKLNDNFGHRAGDELLRAVAERLQGAAGGGDFVSRVGGDEFVVILTSLLSPEQAKESADRIIETVSRPLILEGRDMRPVVSAGLAFSSHRELDPQALVEDADRAMLRVKRSRHRGGPSDGSSVNLSSHRSTRTNDIVARAIREDRLVLAFQPIVSIDEQRIWAFEALVRYLDPELGPISPPSLVARAKGLGLMNELTRQVISKALDAAEQFRRLEPAIDCMTVNLELGQIDNAELGPFIRDAARAHPDLSLCIELNERSLRTVTDELRRDAERMQEAGVLIALDDYGSDDSSVGALVHFPMNILKVDKSLINNLGDVRQREVIKALQTFGDNLGYTVIVEGIENQAMADVMTEVGVRSAQGYHFGRPLPLAQTLERLRNRGARAVPDA